MNSTNRRLRRLEQRRAPPPLPPLDAVKAKLERGLTELAATPDMNADLRRRLARGATELAAERTPTRWTIRYIRDALDDLLLELDGDDDEP